MLKTISSYAEGSNLQQDLILKDQTRARKEFIIASQGCDSKMGKHIAWFLQQKVMEEIKNMKGEPVCKRDINQLQCMNFI